MSRAWLGWDCSGVLKYGGLNDSGRITPSFNEALNAFHGLRREALLTCFPTHSRGNVFDDVELSPVHSTTPNNTLVNRHIPIKLRVMKLPFTKMHGRGNDGVVFDATHQPLPPTSARIRALADPPCFEGWTPL
jgi:hypothetical protein